MTRRQTTTATWHQPVAGVGANNHQLLTDALQVAVPLWIQRHHARPASWLQARALELVDPIASGGDDALYASTRKGASAAAFHAIAEATAILHLLGPESVPVTVCGVTITPEQARRWAA